MKLDRLPEHTRRDQIARRLREMIVSGEVQAGERLTETSLSRQLGVSRAPLREAIRELVDSGLVVTIPYKGLFVRSFTRRDLEELYSLRTTLERFAFQQCWPRRTEQALQDLRARHEALVVGSSDPERASRTILLELDLHNWCYQLADHHLLWDAWQRIRPNLQFYFMLHQRAHSRPGPREDAHRTYVDLATGNDLDAMLEHLEDHLRQGLERTLGLIDTGEVNENGVIEADGPNPSTQK